MGQLSNRSSPAPRHLWLAAVKGARRPHPDDIHPIGEPEAQLEVAFTGITEAQQRAALAGFPGGRRFVLVKNS